MSPMSMSQSRYRSSLDIRTTHPFRGLVCVALALILMLKPLPNVGLVSCSASTTAGSDIVIIIDDSGSMGPKATNNDPLQLRYAGARLFIDLARRGDRVGLVRFADSAEVLNPNHQLSLIEDDSSREVIKRHILDSEGSGGTNFSDALRKAYVLLGDVSRERFVVFLTDGDPTVEKGTLLSELNRFAEGGIPVFVIALGSGINQTVIDTIVSATRSRSIRVLNAGQLIAAYVEIFSFLQDDRYVNTLAGIGAGGEKLFSAEVEDSQYVTDVWFIFAASDSNGEILSKLDAPEGVAASTFTDGRHYQIAHYTSASPMTGEWRFRTIDYPDLSAYALFISSIRLQLVYPDGLGNVDASTRYFSPGEEMLIGAQVVRDSVAEPAPARESTRGGSRIEASISQGGDDWQRVELSPLGLSENNSLHWATIMPQDDSAIQIRLQAQQQQQPLQLTKVYEVQRGVTVQFDLGSPISGRSLTGDDRVPVSVHTANGQRERYDIEQAIAFIESPSHTVEAVALKQNGDSWEGISRAKLSEPGQYTIRMAFTGESEHSAFTSFVWGTTTYSNSLVLMTSDLDFGTFRSLTDTLTQTLTLKPLFASDVPPISLAFNRIHNVVTNEEVQGDLFRLESQVENVHGRFDCDLSVVMVNPASAGVYEGEIAVQIEGLRVRPEGQVPFCMEVPSPRVDLNLPNNLGLGEIWRLGLWSKLGQLSFEAIPYFMTDDVNIKVQIESLIDDQARSLPISAVEARLASEGNDSKSDSYQYSLVIDPRSLPDTNAAYYAQVSFGDASGVETKPRTALVRFTNLSRFEVMRRAVIGFLVSPKTCLSVVAILLVVATYRRFLYPGLRGKLLWKGTVLGKTTRGKLKFKGTGPYYIIRTKDGSVDVVCGLPSSSGQILILAEITPVPRVKKVRVQAKTPAINKWFRVVGARRTGLALQGTSLASGRQFQLLVRRGTSTVAQVTFTYRAPFI